MIKNTVEFPVRYAETDQMRFAHHSNYIIWFEFARVELMKKYGFSYAKLDDQGYMMPVLEARLNYIKAARFDEIVAVEAAILQMPRAKVQFDYKIYSEAGELLCEGYTIHTFMNQNYRAIKPPKPFLTAMRNIFD